MSADEERACTGTAGLSEFSLGKGPGRKTGKKGLSHMASEQRHEAIAQEKTLLSTDWILKA